MPATVKVPILPPFVVAASISVALLLQLALPSTLPPLLRIGIVSRQDFTLVREPPTPPEHSAAAAAIARWLKQMLFHRAALAGRLTQSYLELEARIQATDPLCWHPCVRLAVAAPVLLGGLAFLRRARRELESHGVHPRFKPVAMLITSGPFSVTRNPM